MEMTKNKIIFAIAVLVLLVAAVGFAMLSSSGALFTGSVGGLSNVQKMGVEQDGLMYFGKPQ